MNQLIRGATSQTLTHIPMGLATSVSFSLENLSRGPGDSDRVLASGGATVASWSLTTNAVAGANTLDSRKVAVTATTGASLGAPAVLVSADGSSRELVTVAGITSGSIVRLESGLAGTYASGSTLAGVLLTASIPDAVGSNEVIFNNEDPIRIVWTYTLDGMVHRVPFPVSLGRHTSTDFAIGDAVIKCKNLYPGIADRMPDQSDFQKMVAELALDVADDLRVKGIVPERFLSGSVGTRILISRILSHRADQGYKPGNSESQDGEYAAWARQDYRRRIENASIGLPGEGAQQTENVNDTATAPAYRPFTLTL